MIGVGLKEWAIVCDLLLEGKLAIMLRKGGIHESGGPGVFELEYPRFALFPSWAHQKPEMIKPDIRPRVQVLEEPAEIPLSGVGQAVRIWQIPSREAFDTLDDLHPWTKDQVDMRFNYKPHNPIYVMAVRTWKLPAVKVVKNYPEYAGCKSWVPFRQADEVEETGLIPTMSDEAFDAIVRRVDAAMKS
jgi:hypothetical protein